MAAGFPLLAKRVYTSKQMSRTCPIQPLGSMLRPMKYKAWTEEQMSLAHQAYTTDKHSVRRIAEEYGIPKSNLQDRVSGKVLPGTKSGKRRYLSEEEEEEMVGFLVNCARIGFPRSRSEVIRIVQQVCDRRGVTCVVSHGWWERFCQRHPSICLRTPTTLSHARVKGASPEAIGAYFDTLEETLSRNDLLDKPGQVFNMDETGMPLDPKSMKAIAEKGMKDPSYVSSGNRSQITAVGCICAAGFSIPPMLIYDRKTLHPDMTIGEIPGTFYGFTSNGWMDQELFENWLVSHFLRYAPPVRPLLLLLDGHSSHYSPYAIRIAAKEQIILFTLPPHTSHISQPLDKGCFGPLKVAWRKACQTYMRKNPGKVITRFSFCGVFAEAWLASMTMQNIISSFRATGVFPLDRSQVQDQQCVRDVSLAEEAGIAYIPLFSSDATESREKIHMVKFEEEEMSQFHDHYVKETSKSKNEDRYLLWKKMYHPHDDEVNLSSFSDSFVSTPSKSSVKPKVVVMPKCHSSIQHMFKSQPCEISSTASSHVPKNPQRVLTSADNLKLLDEKQRKKEEAAERKEEAAKRKEEAAKRKEEAAKRKQERQRKCQLKKLKECVVNKLEDMSNQNEGLL